MTEFWTLGAFAIVHFIGVGFFFGALCQKIKDLEDNVKSLNNHLSSIQRTLVDIEVKVMNLNSRLITIERKMSNERGD